MTEKSISRMLHGAAVTIIITCCILLFAPCLLFVVLLDTTDEVDNFCKTNGYEGVAYYEYGMHCVGNKPTSRVIRSTKGKLYLE